MALSGFNLFSITHKPALVTAAVVQQFQILDKTIFFSTGNDGSVKFGITVSLKN